jgi:hypothetical protein
VFRAGQEYAWCVGLHGHQVQLEMDGGGVAKSYGLGALSTYFFLWQWNWNIRRERSRRVSGGDRGWWRLRLPALDDRPAKDIPDLRIGMSQPLKARRYGGHWYFSGS